MPKQYEAMRDKFIKEGMSKDEAQAKAARIYNSRRGNKLPVTGHDHEMYPRKKKSDTKARVTIP